MTETFDAVGSPTSRVAVVLESPNSDELRANKPLMSKSAGVLERALGNAGIISPYMTYVIKTDVSWKDVEKLRESRTAGKDYFTSDVQPLSRSLEKRVDGYNFQCDNRFGKNSSLCLMWYTQDPTISRLSD